MFCFIYFNIENPVFMKKEKENIHLTKLRIFKQKAERFYVLSLKVEVELATLIVGVEEHMAKLHKHCC